MGVGPRVLLPSLQFVTAAAAVALQVSFFGGVGPLGTATGAGVGAAAFFWAMQRREATWINRPRVLSLGVSTFGVMGVLGALCYLACLTWIPQHMGSVVEHPVRAVFAFGLMAAMMGGILAIVVGDLFAWRAGGYHGEAPLKAPRRPGT